MAETGEQMVERWRRQAQFIEDHCDEGDELIADKPCPGCIGDADGVRVYATELATFLEGLRELSAKMAEFDEKYPGPYDRGIPGNIHPIEVLRDDLETLLGERVTDGSERK